MVHCLCSSLADPLTKQFPTPFLCSGVNWTDCIVLERFRRPFGVNKLFTSLTTSAASLFANQTCENNKNKQHKNKHTFMIFDLLLHV